MIPQTEVSIYRTIPSNYLTYTLFIVNQQRRAESKPQVTKVKDWAKDVIYADADAQTEQYLRSK